MPDATIVPALSRAAQVPGVQRTISAAALARGVQIPAESRRAGIAALARGVVFPAEVRGPLYSYTPPPPVPIIPFDADGAPVQFTLNFSFDAAVAPQEF